MKTTDLTTLPDDIESLKKQVLEMQILQQKTQAESQRYQKESKKYQQLYYEKLEKWQLSLKQRFAASSEGYPGQGELFNEAEELLAPSEDEVAADDDHWHQQLLKQPVIWSDDTPVKVIETEKSQCYMWVYGCGADKKSADGSPNIVLYDYQDGRAGACPETFLQGYSGLLQVDGYAGYNHTEATLVGCWAHARRKFIEAKAVQPKGKTGRADQALNLIQKLYGIETSIADATPEHKLQVRQEQSVPIMQQLKVWLDKTVLQVPPKTAIGTALQYSLNQWSKLTVYLEHGLASIDNNRAERAIKPFVIGRKNWLFSNTRSGAKASAILYSLVETAKANDLQPAVYLQALFEQLPHTSTADIDLLSPWNIKLS